MNRGLNQSAIKDLKEAKRKREDVGGVNRMSEEGKEKMNCGRDGRRRNIVEK